MIFEEDKSVESVLSMLGIEKKSTQNDWRQTRNMKMRGTSLIQIFQPFGFGTLETKCGQGGKVEFQLAEFFLPIQQVESEFTCGCF